MTPAEEEKWLEWRRGGITASDVACALTGKYAGAFGVVASKLGQTKPEVKKAQKDDYERGHTWEEKLGRVVEIISPYKVVGQGAWIESAENPVYRCTPDGFLIEPEALDAVGGEASVDVCDAGVEFKSIRAGQDWQWEYFKAQIQWQMHCSGMEQTLLMIAVTGHDNETLASGGMRPYWIERDDDMIAFLVELADGMWAHVKAGTLPEPDTASALPLVRWMTRFANPEAETVDLTEHADLLERVLAIKDSAAAASKERDQKTAVLMRAMGEATKGKTATAVITYSAPNAKGTRTFTPNWKKTAA